MTRIVAAGMAIVVLALSQAAAAPPPKTTAPAPQLQRFGEWSLRCISRPGLPPCDVVHTVKDEATKKPLMQVSYSFAPERQRDAYAAQYQLPLGFMLQAGVLIRLDGKTDIADYPVTRCEPEGCFVERLLKASDLTRFRAASQGVVIVMGKDGKPIGIPFSLKGFDAAVSAMVAKNRAVLKATTPAN